MIRVLFVGSIRIGDSSATGKTLEHMLIGNEKISILQYCLNPLLKDDDYSTLPTVYAKSSDSYINYLIYKIHRSGGIPTNEGINYDSRRKKKHILSKLKHSVLSIQDMTWNRINSKSIEELTRFRPDVIYTLGGGIAVSKVCLKLAKRFNIPILLHSMDDHVHTRYCLNNVLDRIAQKQYRDVTRRIFDTSSCGIAIGPKMKDAYESEFGVYHYVAMNCVDSLHNKSSNALHSPKIIIYSGGVHGGRDEILRKFASIMKSPPFNEQYCLEIFTNTKGMKALKDLGGDNISVSGYVPECETFDNLSRASFLLHVESSDEKYIEYFGLSMSTKIPEYLSTGIPIIAIGDQRIGTINYLADNKVAIVSENVTNVGELLLSFSEEAWINMSKEALKLASRNHITNKVQETIVKAFLCSIDKNHTIKER